MDDDFLVRFRKDPQPGFANRLYKRIEHPMDSKSTVRKTWLNWKVALAGATAILVAALAVSPSAQAFAQDFLNLFRVKRFQPVAIGPERMKQLASDHLDIQSLISSSSTVVKDPGKAVTVDSAAAAGRLAGFTVRTPTVLPPGATLRRVLVQGEGIVRFTADTARLQSLIDALGLTDVQIPAQLNGKTVTVDKPPVVIMQYRIGGDTLEFIQSHNPQIALPDGVNMAQLGEIALRVVGMSADEAHRFAQTLDWSSTLLVPVPANAKSFTKVSVGNSEGLMITTSGAVIPNTTAAKPPETARPRSTLLIWADGDMVYAITTSANGALVDVATSLK